MRRSLSLSLSRAARATESRDARGQKSFQDTNLLKTQIPHKDTNPNPLRRPAARRASRRRRRARRWRSRPTGPARRESPRPPTRSPRPPARVSFFFKRQVTSFFFQSAGRPREGAPERLAPVFAALDVLEDARGQNLASPPRARVAAVPVEDAHESRVLGPKESKETCVQAPLEREREREREREASTPRLRRRRNCTLGCSTVTCPPTSQ